MKLVVFDAPYIHKNKDTFKDILRNSNNQVVILYNADEKSVIEGTVNELSNQVMQVSSLVLINAPIYVNAEDPFKLKSAVEKIAKNCQDTEYRIQTKEYWGLFHVKSQPKTFANNTKTFFSGSKDYGTTSTNTDAEPELSVPEIFEKLSKQFPQDFGGKDVAFLSIAAVISAFSVIPNYYFGGGFIKAFINEILGNPSEATIKKLQKQGPLIAAAFFKYLEANQDKPGGISKEGIENIRTFFALISAVVNWNINTVSLKFVMDFMVNKVKSMHNEKDIKEKSWMVLKFLGAIVASAAGSFPQIEFAHETLKSFTPNTETLLTTILFLVNLAMNVRGIDGVAVFANDNFNAKDKYAAAAIREKIINTLNDLLDKSSKVSPEDIDLLKMGKLYRDKFHSNIRHAFAIFFATLPTGVYDIAYWNSAWEAATVLALRWFYGITPTTEDPYIPAIAKALWDAPITVISYLLKLAFLAKTNYSSVNRIFDKFLANPVLDPNRGGEDQRTTGSKVLEITKEIAIAIVALLSMTGAYGLVKDEMFDDTDTIGGFIGSMVIGELGAQGANYNDTANNVDKTIEAIKTIHAVFKKSKLDIMKRTFGNEPEEFFRRFIRIIAATSNSDILAKYAKPCIKKKDPNAPPTERELEGNEKQPFLPISNNDETAEKATADKAEAIIGKDGVISYKGEAIYELNSETFDKLLKDLKALKENNGVNLKDFIAFLTGEKGEKNSPVKDSKIEVPEVNIQVQVPGLTG